MTQAFRTITDLHDVATDVGYHYGIGRGGRLSQCLSQSLGQTKTPFANPCQQVVCEKRLDMKRRGQETPFPFSQRQCQQAFMTTSHNDHWTCDRS